MRPDRTTLVLAAAVVAMAWACGVLFRSAPGPALALDQTSAVDRSIGASPRQVERPSSLPHPLHGARREEQGETPVQTASLLGLVRTHADGAPVPRFEVAWSGAGGRSGVAHGTDGAFRVEALPVGDYELVVRSEGNLDRRIGAARVAASADPIEILVRPSAMLKVMVQDPSGRAVRGVEVRVEAVEGPSDALPSGVRLLYPDVAGRASAGQLAAGEYRVAVQDGEPRIVRLTPGSTHEVVLRAPSRSQLEVLVRNDEGAPLPGAVIRVSRPNGRELGREVADGEGLTRFDISAGDRVQVRAWKHGFSAELETWELPRTTPAIVTLSAREGAARKR